MLTLVGENSLLFWMILILHATIFGFSTSYIADEKGKNRDTWFIVGALLGIIGLLTIGFSKNEREIKEKEYMMREISQELVKELIKEGVVRPCFAGKPLEDVEVEHNHDITGIIKANTEDEEQEVIYSKAFNKKKWASSEQNFLDAAKMFESISGYRNSDRLAKDCRNSKVEKGSGFLTGPRH